MWSTRPARIVARACSPSVAVRCARWKDHARGGVVVFKIKIKSILKGIRKIKPLKLIVGGAKHIPGGGTVVAEGEKLYSAARARGKSVIGAAAETAGELEHESTMQQEGAAAFIGQGAGPILLIVVGILVIFLFMRRR